MSHASTGERGSEDRRTICLVSPHPLMAVTFPYLLGSSRYRLSTFQLQPGSTSSLDRLRLPAASVCLVDAYLLRPTVEAIIEALLERASDARLLVLAEDFTDASSFRLLRLGVKGMLRYSEAGPHLSRALEVVADGGFWAPRALLSRFMDSLRMGRTGSANCRAEGASSGLTRREREVLDGLLESLSNKEIAGRLNISERTVKFHVSNLLAKFRVQTRCHLIVRCAPIRAVSA